MAGTTVKALRTDMEDTRGPSLRVESSIQEGDEGEIANVLRDPNGTSDVTLVIEGRELYANRCVLAHFSPVFHAMFFSGFKEKSEEKVDLPEKDFQEMVILFNVLLMPSASARCQVSDDTLLLLLALADEYQMDQVKAVCQNYIGGVLFDHFKNFYHFHTNTKNPARSPDKYPIPKGTMRGQKIKRKALIDKLVLYLTACGRYQLPAYRDVRDLLITVTRSRGDLYRSRHYRWLLPSDKQICLPSHETLCDKVFDRVRLDDREDDDRDDDDRDDGDSVGDDSEKDDCEGDAHSRLLRWGRTLGLRGQDLHDFMNVHEIYPNNFVQSLHSGRQIDFMF